MGQTLSSPVTQKASESGGNDRFLYAVSAMQGWRISMEDSHAILLDLDEGKEDTNAFFGVYDGHGGYTVAKFAGENVHKRLVTEETYQQKQYESAMKRAFLGTDEDLRADPALTRDPSGCTAIAALITHDNKIFVANAGDSRSVISVKGEAVQLSFDHKPSNEIEKERIAGAGGFVECGRVNGNLALSRALGDFEFKKNQSMIPEKQIITADPDVILHEITGEDEFFIIACDGIWDCLSSQQVVDFVRLHVSQGKELTEISELMCEHCLAPDTTSRTGIGCDNMTILIVAVLNGRTKEEWYSWVSDRVQQGYGYETPREVHQLYSQSRLAMYQTRRDNLAARRQKEEQLEKDGVLVPSTFGFPTVLGSTGGISYHHGAGIVSDSGTIMFANDESDDDDSGDEDVDIDLYNGQWLVNRTNLPPTPFCLDSSLDEFDQDTRRVDGTDHVIDLHIDDLDLGGQISSLKPADPPSHPDSANGPEDTPSKALPNGNTTSVAVESPEPRSGDDPGSASELESGVV